MKLATITNAKNGLSALIDRVKAGETILLTDRGVPVARIEPVSLDDDPAGNLTRLARSGVVRPPRRSPSAVLDEPPPEPSRHVDVVEMLLEERRSGW